MTEFITARASSWTTLLGDLVRERSVFEQEHGVIALVARQIAALGVDVVHVPHDATRLATLPGAQPPFSAVPGRSSLVARVKGRGSGPSIAFNAHLDIVPEGDAAAWSTPPFAAQVTPAGDLVGRGALDDKAGVAIALALLETLSAAPEPPDGDVVFHFVLEDETTGNGTLLCLDAGHVADAAVIIDGTRLDRAIGQHAGLQRFGVRVTGRAASFSVSHVGINAADALARLLARLSDRVALLNRDRVEPWTRFPSPFQFVTQGLAASTDPLTVPDLAAATCLVTFPPPWTLARMRTFLTEEAAALSCERNLPCLPDFDWNLMAVEPIHAGTTTLLPLLDRAARRVGLGGVELWPSTGTSDLRHYAAAGIPCLLYGPGTGANPHRIDEHYRLADIPLMVRLFADLIKSWGSCGMRRGAPQVMAA